VSQSFSTEDFVGPFKPHPLTGVEQLRRLHPLHLNVLLTDRLSDGLWVDDAENDGVQIKDGRGDVPHDAIHGATIDADALNQILARRWLRAERMNEIIDQQTDILSFLALAYPLTRDTHPMTMAILDAILGAAGKLVVDAKYRLNTPRPADVVGGIGPVIRTPSHGATPSGHATEAWAMAYVMEAMIFGKPSQELRLVAARIEENRIVAGVHYEADGYMGRIMATALAPIFAERLGLENPELEKSRLPVWPGAGQAGLMDSGLSGEVQAKPEVPQFTRPAGVLGDAMAISRAELGYPV